MASRVFYYHKNCTDGFGAAFAAYWRHPKDSEFIPYAHSDKLVVTDESADLYFLDVVPPKEVIDELRAQGRRCIIIDHHKTAFEEYGNEHPDNHFDMSHSGAVLTWKFFHDNGQKVPGIFEYIEDKDLWNWALPKSKEINAALYATPKTFEAFAQFQNSLGADWNGFKNLISLGEKVIFAEKAYVEAAKKNAVIGNFCGYRDVIVVNAIYYNVSELLNELVTNDHCSFAVAWYYNQDGRYKYSLRTNRENMDVGVVAKEIADNIVKEHGCFAIGGGHKNSAGFTSDVLVLPTNKIKL